MVDARERILVQPRDILVLQETPQEAFARYWSQKFNYTIIYDFLRSSRALGTATVSGPQ
jgi:hypothetical protein